jgi:hypothetical protein
MISLKPGFENTWRFELRHQAIVERFGSYPHLFSKSLPSLAASPRPRSWRFWVSRGRGFEIGQGPVFLT